MSGPIHIALTFDDNFWAPAYATARSVCLHTRRRADLVFHLCHRGLTPEHVADLKTLNDEFGATLRFYDITASPAFMETVGALPYDKRLTNIVYARLLFDRLLPPEVTRLLYLDCDMMVVAPIEALWETDLEGRTVGAVPEAWGPFIATGRDFRANRDLFDPADPYFNAGMLLIDMERWRQADIPGHVADFAAKGLLERIYYDQGLLNILFREDFTPIARQWNVIGPHFAHEGLDVRLLHYVGNNKPWNLYAPVALFRTYRHVMTNEIFYRFFRHRLKRRFSRLVPGFLRGRRG